MQSERIERETSRDIEDFIMHMLDDFAIEKYLLHRRLAEMDEIAMNMLAAWTW